MYILRTDLITTPVHPVNPVHRSAAVGRLINMIHGSSRIAIHSAGLDAVHIHLQDYGIHRATT